eukprot:3399518-Pleurochrysis_carterae.AAC.3
MVLLPSRLRARTLRVCASPRLRGVHRANLSLFPIDSGPHTHVMSTWGAAGRVVFSLQPSALCSSSSRLLLMSKPGAMR